MKRLITAIIVASMFCAVSAWAANDKYVVPPKKQVVVTPSDATLYKPPLASLWVGVAGDLALIFTDDAGTLTCAAAPVHLAVPAGLFRGRVRQVCATGTAATNIIGYPVTNSP